MSKKFFLIFILIMTIIFTACSNTNITANNESIDKSQIVSSVESTNSKNNIQENNKESTSDKTESNIKSVILEVYNNKQEIDIDEQTLLLIERSKEVNEPKIDDTYLNIGSLYIIYTNSEDEIEFGHIYTDIKGNVYLCCNENKNNALIKVNDTNSFNIF